VTFSSKVNDLFERLDKVNSDVRKQVGNNYKNVTKQFTPRKTDSFIDAEAKVRGLKFKDKQVKVLLL